jgi:hypothetical protein
LGGVITGSAFSLTPIETKKGSSLPLTFKQQICKLRYSSVQCFVRLYLPADFAPHTAGRAVVSYIKLFANFFKFFAREAPGYRW